MSFKYSDYTGDYIVVKKADNSGLIIWHNGVRRDYIVSTDPEYSYRLSKTRIYAAGGAERLYSQMEKDCNENFGFGPVILHKLFSI